LARYICLADLAEMGEEEVAQLVAALAMKPVEARRLSRAIAQQRASETGAKRSVRQPRHLRCVWRYRHHFSAAWLETYNLF
jgi:hypothetical protein